MTGKRLPVDSGRRGGDSVQVQTDTSCPSASKVSPEGMFLALVATGESLGKALETIWTSGDQECRSFALKKAREPLDDRNLPEGHGFRQVLESLQQVGPGFFDSVFEGHPGLSVETALDLTFDGDEGRGFHRLPAGLNVEGDLLLDGAGIEGLPERLFVKGDVTLSDPHWDEPAHVANLVRSAKAQKTKLIPDSVVIGGKLVMPSDDALVGFTLPEFRGLLAANEEVGWMGWTSDFAWAREALDEWGDASTSSMLGMLGSMERKMEDDDSGSKSVDFAERYDKLRVAYLAKKWGHGKK